MRVLRKSSVVALTAAAFALLLLCTSAPTVHAYSFVPILSVFRGEPSTATLTGDSLTCLQAGGYLATEATALLHSIDVEKMTAAIGASTEFYAFLGGGINYQYSQAGGTGPSYCAWDLQDPDVPNIPSVEIGNATSCLYRWKVGRWQMLTSDVGVEVDGEHAGIAFYQGQNSGGVGPVNGFPSYFYTNTVSVYSRPGMSNGRNVVLFRNSETTAQGTDARWSDNFASGGYTYAEPSSFEPAPALAKVALFQTLCQSQGPFRLNYEEPNASTLQKSNMQYVWWVIFLVILFVLCLIAFLIIACCQEREDMDEPPEEAPEWAEKETEERNVSKRYVSQRSFRDAEGSQRPSRSGSARSGGSRSAGSDERSSISSVSKEDEYAEENAH